MITKKTIAELWCRHPLSLFAGITLVACTLGAIQDKPATELRTQRLVLVDKEGNDRARLFTDDDTGGAFMSFLDQGRQQSLVISADKKGGASIDFYKNRKPQLSIMYDEGHATILLSSRDKELLIQNDDKTGPSISMHGKDDGVRLDLTYNERGQASIVVWGGDGKGSVSQIVKQDGTPKLEVTNGKGESVFAQP